MMSSAPVSDVVNAPRPPVGLLDHRLHWPVALGLLLFLWLLPPILQAVGEDFYVGVVSRVLIFAIAASSLNLILGWGGMVSFGHAALVGMGAYAAGIAMAQGQMSAWVTWPLAALVGAGLALVMGAISLRTQGVYFIMITLALAQMLYYLMVSLKTWGGDDGLPLPGRAELGLGLDLSQDTHFYYVVLVLSSLVMLLLHRIANARLGHTLQAIRDNDTRMLALGVPVYRVKLLAFTLAGGLAGLAGALLANQGGFVSPTLMQWSQSGMLMIMVILGGVGHLYGGLVGAAVFLLLEEVLVAYTIHWQLGLGAVLLAVVLLAPNGLMSLGARVRGLLRQRLLRREAIQAIQATRREAA
jgi:branched-chain amino acid transport system permease protein